MTGAEISQHMCDVAAEAVVMNGYAAKCIMINKDVRHIHAETLPDGTLPDMDYKADLCIFEVRALSNAIAGYIVRPRAQPTCVHLLDNILDTAPSPGKAVVSGKAQYMSHAN